MTYYITDSEKILVFVGDGDTVCVQEDISGKPIGRAVLLLGWGLQAVFEEIGC